jgi:hypothetical protein
MHAMSDDWVSRLRGFPASAARCALAAIALLLGAVLFAGAYWLEGRRHVA